MSKPRSNWKSTSSAQVDYFDLCTQNVRNIEDFVSGGDLLNQAQCKDLSIKLSKVTLNIRELVDKCGGPANLFRLALEDLHRCLEKAKVLVSRCGEKEWCAAAVFQIHNEDAFREVLMEVSLCYNAIYEQAKSMSVAKTIDVEDLRETPVLEPATGDDILLDLEVLRTRLEDIAKEPARSVKLLDHFMTDKGALKQGLAKYLLMKIKYTSVQSWVTSLEACSEIFWRKESEQPGTWGFNHFLGFGAVCKTKWMGIPCAKKIFYVKEYESLFLKEAGIMAHLKHPCVIEFLCCGNGQERGDRFIAMELMEKSLAQLIEDQKGVHFPILVAMDMMVQMARGVCYLHNRGVAHRDLKPENVVVSRMSSQDGGGYYCVKLVDFGMSKTKVELAKSNTMTFVGIGTTKYKAPEVFKQAHLDGKGKATWFRADAYSFAITCVHLLSLQAPFGGIQNADELHERLMSGERPQLPIKCRQELAVLLKDCWNTKPRLRPSFVEIVSRLEEFRHRVLREHEGGDGCLEEGSMDLSAGLEFVKTKVKKQSRIQSSFDVGIDEEEEDEISKQKLPIPSCACGHALEFLTQPPSKYRGCICDLCWKDIEDELYHCDICNFDAHLECATIEVEVKVFFHNHPLDLLIQSYHIDNHDAKCNFCKEVLEPNDWVYCCQECGFEVHALCTMHSKEKMLKERHEHSLDLTQCPIDMNLTCTWCNCQIVGDSWVYVCTSRWCPFEVHPSCTLLPNKPLCMFENAHRLSLVHKRSGFYCGSCGALGFSWSYHCNQCDVVVHLDCLNDMEGEEKHWSESCEELMAQLISEDTLPKVDMITKLLDKFHLNNSLEESLSSTSSASGVVEGCTTRDQAITRSLASSETLDLGAVDFENVDLRKKIVAESAERKAKRMRARAGRLELKVKMLEKLERIVLDLRRCESMLDVGGEVLDSRVEKLKNLEFVVEEKMARLVQSRMRNGPRTCLFFLTKNYEGIEVWELLTSIRADMEGVGVLCFCEEPGHQHDVHGSLVLDIDGVLGEHRVQILQPLLGRGLEVVARAVSASLGELTSLDRVTLPVLGSNYKWDLRAIDLERHGKPWKEEENADALKSAEDSAAEWIRREHELEGWSVFEFCCLLRVRYKETGKGECPGYTRGSVAWLCEEHVQRGLEAGILEFYPWKYYNPELN